MKKIKLKIIGYFGVGIAVIAVILDFIFLSGWRVFLFLPLYIFAFYLGNILGKDFFRDEK